MLISIGFYFCHFFFNFEIQFKIYLTLQGIFGIIFFGEVQSALWWFGLLSILCGIAFVTMAHDSNRFNNI